MAQKLSREEKIQRVLSGQGAKSCTCDITPQSTDDELIALGAGCTHPQFCCPTLDAVRRVGGVYANRGPKEDD